MSGNGDWFCRLFGFAEQTGNRVQWQKTRSAFRYDPETGVLQSAVDPAARAFQAGRFSTPTLAELRGRNALAPALQDVLPGRLAVQEVLGDISELHTLPENRYALFQAASQFNCLEHTSSHGRPEQGIACYAHDRTQGPACATACAPGTVVRNYFADAALGAAGSLSDPSRPGQTGTNQVENLRDVEEALGNKSEQYFEVRAGYTFAPNPSKLKRLLERLGNASFRDALRAKIRVGLQLDTEVTGSKFGAKQYAGPQHVVSQVYCSAVSVSYSGLPPEAWQGFAEMVLEAAYEATLFAAVENAARHPQEPGARKVFLTALGGGVFGNDIRWIVAAMRRAFRRFAGVGLQVKIVTFGHSSPHMKALERQAAEQAAEQAAVMPRPAAAAARKPQQRAPAKKTDGVVKTILKKPAH